MEQSKVGELLYRVCFERRAALVAWDIGVAVGRLASDWGRSTKGRMAGGLSLILSTVDGEETDRHPKLRNGEIDNVFHPRIRIRSLSGTRGLTSYTRPRNIDSRDRKGSRLITSLRPLAESLSGIDVESPAHAAELWELDSPSPLEDATDLGQAFAELTLLRNVARTLFEEHRSIHPSPPSTTTSPGTYAAGLYHRMGLNSPLLQHPNFPKPVLAAAMGAYYAGDVFTRARSRQLPIVKLDLGGAHPVAWHKSGSWDMYSAKEIQVRERDPDDLTKYLEKTARRVRRWWKGQTCKPLSDADFRRLARTIVWVVPDGDWLPHRARTGVKNQGTQMVVGPLTSARPLPFFLADVLVSVLRTGRVPRIVRAIRLVPRGRQKLRPVELPTGRVIDPNEEDPVFALAVERIRVAGDTSRSFQERERLRGLMKGMAVAASSGLPVQVLDDEPTSKPKPLHLWDPLNPDMVDPTVVKTDVLERPGTRYFPPVGASVTATARLLLHLCRGAFEAAGGTVAYWDTDSLFVVATPFGGEIIPLAGGSEETPTGRAGVRALSYRQLHEVQWKIEELSPYPTELRPYAYDMTGDIPQRVDLPGLLKWEPENQPPPEAHGFPVDGPFYDGNRSKRYRTYHIVRPGSHVEIQDVAGVVVEPTTEQMTDLSRVIVTNPSMHGITYTQPDSAPDDWAETLLEEHLEEHLQLGDRLTEATDWRNEIAVSLVAATRIEAIDLHPENRPYSRIAVATSLFGQQLVSAHPDGGWYDPKTQTPVTFDIDAKDPPGLALSYQVPRSIDDQIRRNTTATPSNALTDTGEPVGRNTYGLLTPAPTIVTAVQIIGRESRRWRDGRGILNPPDIKVHLTRTDAEAVGVLIRKHYWWRGAAPLIAEKTGLPVRTVSRIIAGKRPSQRTAERLWEFAHQQRLFDPDQASH
jgi:hypothetical protein